MLAQLINNTNDVVICGVPLGAIPYSLMVSQCLNLPHITR